MNTIDTELLRHAIRRYLVTRRPAAFPHEAVHGALTARKLVDFPITPDDVARELALLEGLGQVEHHTNELGSLRFYSATAAGILAQERAGG